jgi:hypothetical protein
MSCSKASNRQSDALMTDGSICHNAILIPYSDSFVPPSFKSVSVPFKHFSCQRPSDIVTFSHVGRSAFLSVNSDRIH